MDSFYYTQLQRVCTVHLRIVNSRSTVIIIQSLGLQYMIYLTTNYNAILCSLQHQVTSTFQVSSKFGVQPLSFQDDTSQSAVTQHFVSVNSNSV